jgi:ribosome-associated protein
VTTKKRTGGKGSDSRPTRAQSGKAGGKTRGKTGTKIGSKAGAKTDGKTGAKRSTGRFPVRGDLKNARTPARRGPSPTTQVVASGSPSPIANNNRDLGELRELALDLMNAALDKKALMPVLIDVSGMASYTDFIGIVSGRSDRQVDAIADHIKALMKSRGRHVLGHEGGGGGRWTLLDFGSIVIHVFYHPVREFYDLESLWIDAPRVKMAIPPEAMITQPDALYGAL